MQFAELSVAFDEIGWSSVPEATRNKFRTALKEKGEGTFEHNGKSLKFVAVPL